MKDRTWMIVFFSLILIIALCIIASKASRADELAEPPVEISATRNLERLVAKREALEKQIKYLELQLKNTKAQIIMVKMWRAADGQVKDIAELTYDLLEGRL